MRVKRLFPRAVEGPVREKLARRNAAPRDRGWREVEAEFRLRRDHRQKITLPRVAWMEREVGE